MNLGTRSFARAAEIRAQLVADPDLDLDALILRVLDAASEPERDEYTALGIFYLISHVKVNIARAAEQPPEA